VTWGTTLRSWALAQQGQVDGRIAGLRQALSGMAAIGVVHQQPYLLALLAEAYLSIGQIDAGLAAVDEALESAHRDGGFRAAAHLCWLQGDLLLARAGGRDALAAAEASFHQALDVARRQQAKGLELRAALSLSRLWQRQGKRDEAGQLLSAIYSWFTEGFDTRDLQAGRALLAELS
jgi:predicted ATPase